MNRGDIISRMVRLIDLFIPRCRDNRTLQELRQVALDDQRWIQGHDLFDRIRDKTLEAEHRRDTGLETQYLFEEIVAKTIYNLSDTNAPFDEDSPFFVIPNAIALAKVLGPETLAQLAAELGIDDTSGRRGG
jgi:hypothetical protein